jgi:hypothetical protein
MKIAWIVVIAAVVVTPVLGSGSTDIEIKPGPATMSDAEKKIVADVDKNVQHGVILLEEMDRNDDYGNAVAVTFHMRAKILSPEGRELADVVIPTERGDSDLTAWWGRTILPNGEVKELPQSELKAQFLAKTAYGKFQELRGALPVSCPVA